ncbi:MAG: Shikimate 5-dehydrogenase C-terminal domain, partial [Bacteroidota bacterium]
NDLVVAAHGVAGRDSAGGDFVPRWDQASHRDALHRGARKQLLAADDHVIGGMEMFIGQAKRSFHLWTGLEMPEEAADVLL